MRVVPAIERNNQLNCLRSPFNTCSSEELLSYYQNRKGVQYFAVASEAEVTRDKIDKILANTFNFNEESYTFANGINWLNNPSTDIEWSIMLHKFYFAVGLGMAFEATGNPLYTEKWIELTSSWIHNVPVNFLPADVMGRRIQNWVFAHFYFVREGNTASIPANFYDQFLASIQQQVSYLCDHLTPARNHRTLELYTIFLVAVVFPEFSDAERWLKFSIQELLANVQSDILPDGVHCELSTDYHHIVLRNLLAVKRLAVMNNITLPDEIDNSIKRALDFSLYVHKPDGIIPSLSDGDTGSFLDLLQQGYALYGGEELRYVFSKGKQGVAPVQRSSAFAAGGYYILRSDWNTESEAYQYARYLVFDCGPLGAGNHGHLDLLSFEMAAYGQSLIVDPGRYTYDESGETNWRVLFRGTGYHNTVQVDDKNQTRYEFHNEKFKIKGLPPRYLLKTFLSQPGFDYLHGIAVSQEYPVVHERKIVFVNGEYWLICDILRAKEVHNYDLLFHLSALAHNRVGLNTGNGCYIVDTPHLVLIQPINQSSTLSQNNGYISSVYGMKQTAPVIKFNREEADCAFYTILYPYHTDRPAISVKLNQQLDPTEGSSPLQACSLTVAIKKADSVVVDTFFLSHEGPHTTVNQLHQKDTVCYQRKSAAGELLFQFDSAASGNQNELNGNML